MKEGTPEYRKNLKDKLDYARAVDPFVSKDIPTVAQEYFKKASGTKEYIDAKEDYRNETKPARDKRRTEIEQNLKNERGEDPEENRQKAISELRKEMEQMGEPTEMKEVKNVPEKPRILQAENKENINESPDKAILAMLSLTGEYNKEFPMYLQDAERMQEMTKQFSETIEGIKAKFREEYRKGLTIQDFYNKYNFFSDKEKGGQGLGINSPYLYGSKEKPWNQVLEKLGVKERPKYVKGGSNLKGNVGYISMGLSSDYKYVDHSRKFDPLGILPDKKKGVQKDRSVLSESAQIALAKRFGIIEQDYNGPLLQHPNFGGGELNRADQEYYYTKNIRVPNIPGAVMTVFENKNYIQKHHPEAKGINLNLSKEFFDEVLKREMGK